jgi:anti-sigma B factor antagonist
VEFGLTTTSVDDKVVVAVEGDIDMKTAPDLEAHIDEVLDGGARAVIVDLTAVEFLDSSGLGALAAARNHAATTAAALAIVCSNPNLLKLFRITGMDRVLTIHPDLDAAR